MIASWSNKVKRSSLQQLMCWASKLRNIQNPVLGAAQCSAMENAPQHLPGEVNNQNVVIPAQLQPPHPQLFYQLTKGHRCHMSPKHILVLSAHHEKTTAKKQQQGNISLGWLLGKPDLGSFPGGTFLPPSGNRTSNHTSKCTSLALVPHPPTRFVYLPLAGKGTLDSVSSNQCYSCNVQQLLQNIMPSFNTSTSAKVQPSAIQTTAATVHLCTKQSSASSPSTVLCVRCE